MAFVLVLLAAASFAAGIAASRTSDTLVYLSIFFSLAAFVVLAIASLRARQAARETGDAEPVLTSTHALDETEAHAGALVGGLDKTQLDMTPSWQRQSRLRWETALEDEDEEDDEDLEEQLENEEDEADFEVPIAPVAVGRLDEFHWADDDEPEEEAEQPTAAYTPVLDDGEQDEADEFDELDVLDVLDIPEPEPDVEVSFFDEYDDLTAAEIIPSLRELDLEGLEWVRKREQSGANRTTVMTQVERLIVDQGGRPSRTTTKTTKKRTTAKKAAPARRAAKKTTRRR